ncbi:ABR protein, partial [Polypterus senegalus]
MFRRNRRHSSPLRSFVRDTQTAFLFIIADYYNTDGYDGDATDDHKCQDGSEAMPYIDESPTMSPQLSARSQDSGDAISPSPHDLLGTGVGLPEATAHFGHIGYKSGISPEAEIGPPECTLMHT